MDFTTSMLAFKSKITNSSNITSPTISGGITNSISSGLANFSNPITSSPAMSDLKHFFRLGNDSTPTNVPATVENIPIPTSKFAAYMISSSPPKLTKASKEGKLEAGLAVRRPTLGVVPKENTYASLSLVSDMDYKDLPMPTDNTLYDSLLGTTKNSRITTNFMITNASQQRVENFQIMQTFGKTYLFFFGEKPTSVAIQGYLLNSRDFNWRNDFLRNYQEVLRASKATAEGRIAVLAYDDFVIQGYILNLSIADDNEMRELSRFTFEFLVKKIDIVPSYDYTLPAQKPTKVSKTKKDSEGNPLIVPDPKSSSHLDYEYMGAWGPTNSDGNNNGPKVIVKLSQTMSDALSKYIGFDLASISRFKVLGGLMSEGKIQSVANVGLIALSDRAESKGCDLWDIGRIL
jgi:hypothetical protein